MSRLRSLVPRRIAMQLALVAGASALLIQIIVGASFFLLHPPEMDGHVHVDPLVRLLAGLPAGEERRARFEDMRRAFPDIGLALSTEPPRGMEDLGGLRPFGPNLDTVRGLGVTVRAIHRTETGGVPLFAFGLSGGEWLVIEDEWLGKGPPPPPFTGPLVVAIAFAGVSSVLLALWAAHAVVRPLRTLAAAAREFDIEGDPRPLPDTGPEEVRVASRAFDAMRRRIRDLVEDRTRMLAAMGHDLRTPITRLRLRSEFLGDETAKAEFLRDLAMTSDMIEGALTYLREGRQAEKPVRVDLAALVATVCDGAADLGRDVTWDGPSHLIRRVRPQALSRALANLVDNAVKYGLRARVRLIEIPRGARMEIEDDGPGIAEADRLAMLRPFVRGDAARNLNDSQGFGLGLAIARAAVEGHGGSLTFDRAASGGLLVRMELFEE